MNRLIACWAAALLACLTPLAAHGQVIFSQDFEGEEFPPFVTSVDFNFGGVSAGTDPFDPFPQEIVVEGPDNNQAYRVSFDTSGVQNAPGDDFSFFFGGWGIFAGFFGEGSRTGEAPGRDNPNNWTLSVDVRSEGALDPNAVLSGNFEYFDPDYDTVFGVDGNGNGTIGGATTYKLPLTYQDSDTTDNNFTTNTFSLGVGSGDVTTDVDGDIVRFNDDGNWLLNFNFNNGLYGNTAGNTISIDNITIEFTPPPLIPGDYNVDGIVDQADYTLFRDNFGTTFQLDNEGDGVTPGEVTIEDYDFWLTQFGNTAPPANASAAVPEPASACLAAIACLLVGRRRINH